MALNLSKILDDAKGFLDYRNRVYQLNLSWPPNKFSQIIIALQLFRHNHNGFRDVCYYRIGLSKIVSLLKKIYKPTSNCVLDIGTIASGGCMFHHAFSTYINAEYVGYQCTFRNNTTVGNKITNGKLVRPYLEDHIFVGANCLILGGVRIGHHSIIGAGAVVTKNVPPYSVVVGNPAKVIKTLQE